MSAANGDLAWRKLVPSLFNLHIDKSLPEKMAIITVDRADVDDAALRKRLRAGWISGRLVLLAPHAFGSLHQDGKVLVVNLTRKQIENSPSIETHKPVSRQYEEEYHQYYGWPTYWDGGGMWGMMDFPALPPPTRPRRPFLSEKTNARGSHHEPVDPHLRSTQAMSGYHIQASDGTIGHASDFIMDDKKAGRFVGWSSRPAIGFQARRYAACG